MRLTTILLLISMTAFGQIRKIDRLQEIYWIGTFDTVKFDARGYVNMIIEPKTGDEYEYMVIRRNKVVRDSVLVQAESHVDMSGIATGVIIGSVDRTDWLKYTVNLKRTRTTLVYRYTMGDDQSGKVDFRTGSITGPVIASIDLPPTGGWNNFISKSITINFGTDANVDLYLTFTGSQRQYGAGGNVDYWYVK